MGVDIKSLLEQDRQLVLEILDNSSKLVLELQAAHYWTKHSSEVCTSMRTIGGNLARLIEAVEPQWAEGKLVFNRTEGMKLWNTALGLYQALPPIRQRFVEMLSRRRRERIMGMTVEEPEEFEPGVIESDTQRYQELLREAGQLWESLGAAISRIPAGIFPQLESAPSANGQMVPPQPGAHVDDVAAPAAAEQAESPAQPATSTPAQTEEPDEGVGSV